MLRIKNNKGKTVMEILDDGNINVLSEKLKKEILEDEIEKEKEESKEEEEESENE